MGICSLLLRKSLSGREINDSHGHRFCRRRLVRFATLNQTLKAVAKTDPLCEHADYLLSRNSTTSNLGRPRARTKALPSRDQA